MERITIACEVPLSAAVAQGKSNYGRVDVELTDEHVASLSPDGKAELARGEPLGKSAKPLIVDVADVAHVLAALEARVAKRREEAERPAREREARIVAALAKPDAEWISSGTRHYLVRQDGSIARDRTGISRHEPETRYPDSWYRDQDGSDPRVQARIEAVRTGETFRRRHAEFEASYAEWLALVAKREECEAREAEIAKQRGAACSEALRRIALSYDDLARAAREGYPVNSQVLDAIADGFAERVDRRLTGVHHSSDSDLWTYDEEKAIRSAPRPDAFRLLDAVTAEAKASELLPAIGSWKVSKILRLDVCSHDRESHKVTAVLATLETPCGNREITFSTESLDCGHDQDSDE